MKLSHFLQNSYCPRLLSSWLIILIMALALFIIKDPATAQDKPGADPFVYSLSPDPQDGPKTVKLKAALRLLTVYSQTEELCRRCDQAAVFKGYAQSNGSSVGKVVNALRQTGGLTQQWKEVVDKEVREGVDKLQSEADCDTLAEQIRQGDYSIYKGIYEKDFELIK
jgi:hypothetical protein